MGAREGGVGLGVWGAVGLLVLGAGFGVNNLPPTDVMLIIVAVITSIRCGDTASVSSPPRGTVIGIAIRVLRRSGRRGGDAGSIVCSSCVAQGFNDAAYAASEIMSSIESFSTTGFMSALPAPPRMPARKS
jgi:anaerobic C4-dicarboxylate transporter